jgi:hypothetical protein
MTDFNDFMCDMLRQPLDRIKYKTCFKSTNEDGTFKINIIDDYDAKFMIHYEKYITMLDALLHRLDHFTYLPFIAMWRESGIANVDSWINGGIKLPNEKMIRFYIMKKDCPRFHDLPLGHMIRFWSYSKVNGGHEIIEGQQAYDLLQKI